MKTNNINLNIEKDFFVNQTNKILNGFYLSPVYVKDIQNKRSVLKDKNFKKNYSYPNLKIGIIGVGGVGIKIVNSLISTLGSVNKKISYYAIDSDQRSLTNINKNVETFLLKENGMGVGGDWNIAYKLTEDNNQRIKSLVKDVEFAIVIHAIGKGTGTGGSVSLINILKQMGILVLNAIVYPYVPDYQKDLIKQYNYWLNQSKKVTDSLLMINAKCFYRIDESIQSCYSLTHNTMVNNILNILDLSSSMYPEIDGSSFLNLIRSRCAFGSYIINKDMIQDTFLHFNTNIKRVLDKYLIDDSMKIKKFLIAIKNGYYQTTNRDVNKIIYSLQNAVMNNADFCPIFYSGYSHINSINIIVLTKIPDIPSYQHNTTKNVSLNQTRLSSLTQDHVKVAHKEMIYSTDQITQRVNNQHNSLFNINSKPNTKKRLDLNAQYVDNNKLLDSMTQLFMAHTSTFTITSGE